MKKRRKLRNSEYYNFQALQDELFKQSRKNVNFTKLYENIISEDNILLAFRNIKKNTGSKTKGTDGKTISSIERLSQEELIELIDIHKLVHTTKEETIAKYRNKFSLNEEQIASINKLRKSAHNKPIQ